MPNKLEQLEIFEISLVDKGANPEAKVLIAKANTTKAESMTLKELMAKLSEEEQKVVMDALAAAAAPKEAEEPKEPVGAEDGEPKEEEKAEDEEMAKRDREIAELKKQVNELTAEKRDAEYLTKAKKLPALLGTPEEKRDLLKACAAVLPSEIIKKLDKLLEDANTKIAKGAPLDEKGSSATTESGAAAKLAQLAKEYAAEHKLKYEQAFTRVCDDNKDLVAKARQEG